ncbi:hypothetical protein ROD_48831 [Citrobacter rodentium ICC168]|uniref:Uncharacterized protein n=1 Tax=Citrobacter rodentium (strain ICC168) TaxID=637910 RepID=D2TRX5_CITRI|nr:hypothetical protein ROD_48831 [Citrobacter rodentium ICC168]
MAIDINSHQDTITNIQEKNLLLSKESNSVCIEIDERITKILECKHKYQLENIIGDIIPNEDESAEAVFHLMRILNEQYHKIYNESGCIYKCLHGLTQSNRKYTTLCVQIWRRH